MNIEDIGNIIVTSAIKIHKTLGPGLLESAYQKCIAYELRQNELKIDCELNLPMKYGEIQIDTGYRIDMLVENSVIIENKAVEQILPIHEAQILTYLKLKNCRLGFILNWNVTLMKNGIRRFVHSSKLPEGHVSFC